MKRLIPVGLLLLTIFSGCGGREHEEHLSGENVALTAPSYAQREGAVVFAHYCAPCHGVEGAGDGFNAFNLDPKPRDLTTSEFDQERSKEDLAALIRRGGRAAGLSASMPPWGRTLNERQIQAVVEFVRTLPQEPVDAGKAR